MVLVRVGLTGASGMLGRHINAELKDNGYELALISHKRSPQTEEWNLTEWQSDQNLDRLFAGVTCVITCGAIVNTNTDYLDRDMYDANVRSCINIGEWALRRGVRVIHISGAIVYKDPYAENIYESNERGYSGVGKAYGLTKVLADHIFENLRTRGLRVCILRPSSIYGYGISQSSLIGRFLRTSSEGGGIYLNQPIDDMFNLIHAADVASAVRLCLNEELNATINVGGREGISLLEICTKSTQVVGNGCVSISKEPAKRESHSLYRINSSLAEDLIGWVPKIDLEQGLRLTFEGRLKS